MNTSLYIARRYFFSKSFRNVINIISGIAVTGVAVGSMALIVVLSVFNGFEDIILSLVNAFNPDLKVTVREGKVFHMNDMPMDEISKIPGLVHYTQVVEDNALFRYEEQQHVGVVKGVDSTYINMTPLDTMLLEGKFRLQQNGTNYGVLGQGVAYYLGVRLNNFMTPLTVFVPRRDATPGTINPMAAFNQRNIYPSGVFGIQPEIDEHYIIIPLELARELYNYEDEVTALEIAVADNANSEQIAERLREILGPEFEVSNRIQQQQVLYRILRSEKWMTFLILSFILIIATFNVIGSLTLIILDKRKDIAILFSMGAGKKLIKQIFMLEGMLVSFTGAVAGLLLGGIIAFVQQEFGIIGMGGGETFIIDAYPVKVKLMDFVSVFVVVMLIGWLTSLFPVRLISRKLLSPNRRINPE